MNRRSFLKISAAAGTATVLSSHLQFLQRVLAAQGTPLPGSQIPQFVDELPTLVSTNPLAYTAATDIILNMEEFRSPVMPSTFLPGTYQGTYVWGYRFPEGFNSSSYIGPVVLAQRGTPTQIRFVNNLGSGAGTQVTAWFEGTDQTLHWADPLDEMGDMTNPNFSHYIGSIPAVPHLHGGEVPPVLDGGPDAWFTSDGQHTGHAYYSQDGNSPKNYAIYIYPNTQEAANIWFHDHALGITRLNVYAGLAGAYLLSDPNLSLPSGLTPHGLGDELMVPLVIQDRSFDTNGQFYIPNAGINPEHPFWVPEFVGDTIVVNGKVWPTWGTALARKPSKRYRFLFLNGSNARTYELSLTDPVTKVMGPPLWVIGTDGGYLDTPVKIDPNAPKGNVTKLTLMPGERYDVIVDFNDPTWRALNPNFSGTLVLKNSGKTPYPAGATPTNPLDKILKLFVGAPVLDASYDPASGVPLRPTMVRLVSPGAVAPAVQPSVKRQLTLNEVMAMPTTVNGVAYPGGPLEILVNNTRWDGKSVAKDKFPDGIRPDFTAGLDGNTYYSEFPAEGTSELWEIINLTADAHPIHTHLVQFQILNRQALNINAYNAAYNALFPASSAIDPMTGTTYPGGVFIGGYGPPLNYNTGNSNALGGNPDVNAKNKNKSLYLQGVPMPAQTYERGWKDTVVALPGQVTRLLVRFAPTDTPAGATGSFPFDPDGGHGYVWHCHIIDHEDNEMMRPYAVKTVEGTPRSYNQGEDY